MGRILVKAAVTLLAIPTVLATTLLIYAIWARQTGPVLVETEPRGPATMAGANRAVVISDVAGRKLVASIDVFEVPPDRMNDAVRDASSLLDASRSSPVFRDGVLLKGLPNDVQPLEEFGFVPEKAWVAIYTTWASEEGAGHGATPAGRAVLRAMASYSSWAADILSDPMRSLYEPTLIDATGELCNHRVCGRGVGIGPLIDEANSRATFINVFETTPGRQRKLLETTYSIMPVAREHAGYLRTALHRSLDGNRVANVGQYETYRQIGDMYYHLRTLMAFGGVFVSDVTRPLFCLLDICVGDYPRLRTYSVQRVVGGAEAALFSPKSVDGQPEVPIAGD